MSFEACERSGDDITNAEQLHVCRTCWDAFMRNPDGVPTVDSAVCIACGIRADSVAAVPLLPVEAHALLMYEYGRRGVPLDLCVPHSRLLEASRLSVSRTRVSGRGGHS